MVHSSAEALKAAIVGYEPLGLGTPDDCKCTPSQHTTDTHHHNTPQHNRRQHRTPHHTTPTTPHTPHHTTLHFCWNRLSLLPLTASQSRRCCCDLRMEIGGSWGNYPHKTRERCCLQCPCTSKFYQNVHAHCRVCDDEPHQLGLPRTSRPTPTHALPCPRFLRSSWGYMARP